MASVTARTRCRGRVHFDDSPHLRRLWWCRPGCSATEAEIIAHARQSVAGYKLPKVVQLRSEPLPLSAAMKVLKGELRASFRRPGSASGPPE